MRIKSDTHRNKSDWVFYTIGTTQDVEASRQEAAKAAQAARIATWIKWRWFDLLYTLLLGGLLLSHHPSLRLLLDIANWPHILLFCWFVGRSVVSWRLWLLSKYPDGVTLAVRP